MMSTPSFKMSCAIRHPINRLFGATSILLLLLPVLCFQASSLSLPSSPLIFSSSSSSSSSFSSSKKSGLNSLRKDMGETALEKVQWLGGLVSNIDSNISNNSENKNDIRRKQTVEGTGGSAFNNFGFATKESSSSSSSSGRTKATPQRPKEKQVWTALAVLERDSKFISFLSLKYSKICFTEAGCCSLLYSCLLSFFSSHISASTGSDCRRDTADFCLGSDTLDRLGTISLLWAIATGWSHYRVSGSIRGSLVSCHWHWCRVLGQGCSGRWQGDCCRFYSMRSRSGRVSYLLSTAPHVCIPSGHDVRALLVRANQIVTSRKCPAVVSAPTFSHFLFIFFLFCFQHFGKRRTRQGGVPIVCGYWSHIRNSGTACSSTARFSRFCRQHATHDTNIPILSNRCHFGSGCCFVGVTGDEIVLQSGDWYRKSTICKVRNCGPNMAQFIGDRVAKKLWRYRKMEVVFFFDTSCSIAGNTGTGGTTNKGECQT
jgi:hypothetical protein